MQSIMDNEQSTNASAVPESAGRRRINIQQIQNVLLIWLDSNIDETNDDCQSTITKLRRVVNDINTYTNSDQCLEFIQTVINKKVCMVISGSLGQHIVPRVHNMSQIDSIFIFCVNRQYHEQWAKGWSKIKGVLTDITHVCEALKKAAHQCEQNAISMSFVETNKKLDQLDPSFMYTQIMKEILLTITFKQNHIRDYFDYCRDAFADNKEEMINIERLESQYHKKTPVYWYTCQMFLYPMLNRALRLMNGDIITRMGFFISDLHRQIRQLHKKQYAGTTTANTFTVYRGQGLSPCDFEQMMKIKGGLISFNNFLSTSTARNISLDFAQDATTNPDQVGVLFIMKINPAQSTTPFASIAGISKFQGEEEVLFSMHSVFRIQDIKFMGGNHRLFEVHLTLTADNDPELSRLTDYIRKQSFPVSEAWYRLGMVLRKMGQLDKAEDIYDILLRQIKDDEDKAPIYHQLGTIKYDQGKYHEALRFYETSLAIYQKPLSSNHSSLAASYNNIGLVHDSMGSYPKALSSHEKALEIKQKSFPPNHRDLADSYNNIGTVHAKMGNYPKALSYHEKALEIRQQSLPPNHPDLAASYNNIGTVHNRMGNYPEALSYHEKSFEIKQKSLAPNHPSLAQSYNNIGLVHYNMGNYPAVFSFHEKALKIREQSLPSNHPDLASSYNNIGEVHAKMNNYSETFSFYKKALKIQEQSLLSNHPDLAISYNNIGEMYVKMGHYPKALPFYEKAFKIRQQSLSPNHPDLAISYNNIGEVYVKTDYYSEALPFYERALEIRQGSLPPNHPDLAISNNNIGEVYVKMGHYPKALPFYETALVIKQQILLANHLDLASFYNNIGNVHYNMGNYSKALPCYEIALEIKQKILPPNHLDLASSYNNIGNVYYNMGNYLEALSYSEKAREIEQESLSSQSSS
ncbi:unnamed protein product [Adineta steineri]|uniref:ADP ribosyltransferase domain-containing protein n=1 Tax=Adineta steineri TaxID=433720 RepID=A0A818ZHS5_9BILA|nr:unnamed protein product [Adineta steineri]